jgi:hypothetical protein
MTSTRSQKLGSAKRTPQERTPARRPWSPTRLSSPRHRGRTNDDERGRFKSRKEACDRGEQGRERRPARPSVVLNDIALTLVSPRRSTHPPKVPWRRARQVIERLTPRLALALPPASPPGTSQARNRVRGPRRRAPSPAPRTALEQPGHDPTASSGRSGSAPESSTRPCGACREGPGRSCNRHAARGTPSPCSGSPVSAVVRRGRVLYVDVVFLNHSLRLAGSAGGLVEAAVRRLWESFAGEPTEEPHHRRPARKPIRGARR